MSGRLFGAFFSNGDDVDQGTGYHFVKVSVTEIALYKSNWAYQTDLYKLESKPGKTGMKVIEDQCEILYQGQVVNYTNMT